ncbi:hypothetical protein QZH41_003706 [Actinostola sp. cb2023]|nr:hypothetical protein QZH41_003706 [Actinostola sp. cb2023]
MCILSSREHSCIHPRVSKNGNKNEECRKLLDPSVKGETCFYFQKNSVIGTQAGIKSRGLLTAWDIEDLVRVGKKSRACPYYSARELMREADIIFCPYNYLIDPKIRKQMDIDLKDQIIILDEAHNIEDSARESASLTIDTMELQETLDDLDKMIQWKVMPTEYQSLHLMFANLKRWITECSEGRMKDRGFEQAVLVLSGDEILSGLKDAGLTAASCTIYRAGGWKRAGFGARKEWKFSLNFWCFNPAVVGIPFPNTKDLKVDLKRKYNDAYASKRGLLNGSEWYEIQAYRALNQALGRCIRHKQDWGAILLVDERFSKAPRYSNGISKWIRQRIHHYKDFKQALDSLKDFADARQLVPCPATQTPKCTTIARPSTVGEGGFFTDSSPNKDYAGTPNGLCTPLTSKNDISKKDGALKGSVVYNQSTPGSPLVPPNQHSLSTPGSQLRIPNGNIPQTSMSGVEQSVLFVPSNGNVVAMNPGIRQLRPTTPMTPTPPQQVVNLTPLRLNSQATTGQTPLANSTTKVILFTSPSNAPLHVNTPENHVTNVIPNSLSLTQLANTGVPPRNVSQGNKVFVYPTGQTEPVKGANNVQINPPKTGANDMSLSAPAQSSDFKLHPTADQMALDKEDNPIHEGFLRSEQSLQSGVVKVEGLKKPDNLTSRPNQVDSEQSSSILASKDECLTGHLPVHDVDMCDMECPGSPDLFSTPPTEDTAQTCRNDSGKDGEDVPHNHSEASGDQEIHKENVKCLSVGAIVDESAVEQSVLLSNKPTISTTPTEHQDGKSEISTTVKKMRVSTNGNENQQTLLSLVANHDTCVNKARDNPGAEASPEDQTNKAANNVASFKRNLRRTVRRTTRATPSKFDGQEEELRLILEYRKCRPVQRGAVCEELEKVMNVVKFNGKKYNLFMLRKEYIDMMQGMNECESAFRFLLKLKVFRH